MTLPDGFSSWEHLQSLLMSYQNRVIRSEFNDLSPEDQDWDPDINIPRGSLRVGCTLQDSDTSTITALRLWLFYGIMRKASDFHPPIYGLPVSTYQESVKFAPQISLYFCQDYEAVPDGDYPVEATVSYRLIRETPASLTESKARALANEIKNTFSPSHGYTWRKGKILVTYRDNANGYNLQIYAYSESEARELIQKILSLNEHTLENDFLTVHTPEQSNLTTPPHKTIYGKSRKMSRWRPNAVVRFRYAALKIHGLPNDIILIDNSGRHRNPLVRA
jgi:hypothetical protein